MSRQTTPGREASIAPPGSPRDVDTCSRATEGFDASGIGPTRRNDPKARFVRPNSEVSPS